MRVPLLKVFSGFVVVAAIFVALSWQGHRHASLGSEALEDVIATGEVLRAYRGITVQLTRLQAYTQLVANGDHSFDAALRQQLESVDAQVAGLNARAAGIRVPIQEETRRFKEEWTLAGQAVEDLLALSTHQLRSQGEAYNQVLRGQINALIAGIGSIEAKLGEHQKQAARLSRQWKSRVSNMGFYFSVLTSAAIAVLFFVFLTGVWLPAFHVSRMIRRIRLAYPGLSEEESEVIVHKALQAYLDRNAHTEAPALTNDEAGFFQNLDGA